MVKHITVVGSRSSYNNIEEAMYKTMIRQCRKLMIKKREYNVHNNPNPLCFFVFCFFLLERTSKMRTPNNAEAAQ
jgi:hypothetical protein